MTNLSELQHAGDTINEKLLSKEALIIVKKNPIHDSLFFNQYIFYYLTTLPHIALFRLDFENKSSGNLYEPWTKALGLSVEESNEQGIINKLRQIKETGKQPVFVINQDQLLLDFDNLQTWKFFLHDPDPSHPLFTTIQIASSQMPFGWDEAVQEHESGTMAGNVTTPEEPGRLVTICHGFNRPWAIKYFLSGSTLKKLLTNQNLIGDVFKKLDQIIWYLASISLYLDTEGATDQLAQLHEQLNVGEIDETIHGLQVMAKNL